MPGDRVVVVGAEEIIGLGAHDHLDGCASLGIVNLGEQSADFIRVFFVNCLCPDKKQLQHIAGMTSVWQCRLDEAICLIYALIT